ncbi:MAG: hypothetical protein ABJB66_14740, partial [Gemmatimonadaceae bacterium]
DIGEMQLWKNVGAKGEMKFERDTTFKLKSYPDAMPAVGDLFGNGNLNIFVGTLGGGIRWFEPIASNR